MSHRGTIGLLLVLGQPAWAQELPINAAPVTAGVVTGELISAAQVQESLLTLVNAVNELHGEVETLRGELADRDRRLAAVEGLTQGTRNLAFAYDVDNSGRFAIWCVDPEAEAGMAPCSPENPGYVVMPSVRHGGLVSLRVTDGDHFFHDNRRRNSDIAGNTFNTEPGRPWPSPRPFFIYAVNGDDTDDGLRFALSLHPAAVRVPQYEGDSTIGRRGLAATANEPIDFVFLAGDELATLVALYKRPGRPVLAIGSIEMSKVLERGLPEDWRVDNAGPGNSARDEAGLATSPEWDVGLGRYPWHRDYDLPVGGARGTAEGSFFRSDGGVMTCAVDNIVRYRVCPDGLVRVFIYLSGCGGTAQNFPFVPPYVGPSTALANDGLNFTLGLSGVVIDPDGAPTAFAAPLTSTFNGSAFYSLFWSVVDGALTFTPLPNTAGVNFHIETVYRVFVR